MPWFWITSSVDVADKLNRWKTDPIKMKSEIFKKKKKMKAKSFMIQK